ncbi:hypothetical protein [Undibacterium sp.]|jgi:hypothetical protein|nr:hypothetical protein [Undibacterium sp.]HTD03240.1 hypothetical protein [Undibacterium sp.]
MHAAIWLAKSNMRLIDVVIIDAMAPLVWLDSDTWFGPFLPFWESH